MTDIMKANPFEQTLHCEDRSYRCANGFVARVVSAVDDFNHADARRVLELLNREAMRGGSDDVGDDDRLDSNRQAMSKDLAAKLASISIYRGFLHAALITEAERDLIVLALYEMSQPRGRR